jgi:hypothetical protein
MSDIAAPEPTDTGIEHVPDSSDGDDIPEDQPADEPVDSEPAPEAES